MGETTTVPPPARPLLVTGLPRSGTSWVGKMLEASGQVVYINEPLNPRHPPGRSPGVLDADVTHQFQYICADNEPVWLSAFSDTLALRYRLGAELRRNRSLYDFARAAKYFSSFVVGRLRGRRPMLDDPYAVLSTAWFVERLGCQAVVLVRDPVSFVASWKRLGWTTHFRELLDQPLLVRDLLGPTAEELRTQVGYQDHIARAALLWRLTYSALAEQSQRLADVHLRRYESLAKDPETAFRELYQTFGLHWTDRVRERVLTATAHGMPSARGFTWSIRGGLSRTAFRPMDAQGALSSYRDRLTPEEVDRVRDLTSDVAETCAAVGL